MKNKNALKYEMTDWKQLQIRKQNTKEVISVQKTKLRQELKRQRKLQAELERLSKINTNWYDEIFKLAHTQNYIVSLSGGSE